MIMENKVLNQSKIDEALLNFKKANYQETIHILENLNEKDANFLICWYLGHSYFKIYDYHKAIIYVRKSIELKNSYRIRNLK